MEEFGELENFNRQCRVCVGGVHTLAIDTYNEVWSFGSNDNGELGKTKEEDKNGIPSQILPQISIKEVACGYYHSACVSIEDEVWTFGRNFHGQLGLGHHSNQHKPQKVLNLSAISVVCGLHHTICISTDGEAWGFGKNNTGQLGVGNKTDQLIPVQVKKFPNDIVKVACGLEHSIFLDSKGFIYGTGENIAGQLGFKAKIKILDKPKQVKDLSNIISVICGSFHTIVMDLSKNIYVFGANTRGQLGINTGYKNNYQYEPKKLSNLDFIPAIISCGYYHTLIIDNGGSLWVTGCNMRKQIGNLPGSRTTGIVRVAEVSNIGMISSGGNGTILKDSDGNVWRTGEITKNSLGLTQLQPGFHIDKELEQIVCFPPENSQRAKSARK